MSNPAEFLDAVLKYRVRIDNSSAGARKKISQQYQLFTMLINHYTERTNIPFTSIFAQLSYIITTAQIPFQEGFILHSFRRGNKTLGINEKSEIAACSIDILLYRLFNHGTNSPLVQRLYQLAQPKGAHDKTSFQAHKKVLIQSIDIPRFTFEAVDSVPPFEKLTVSFEDSGRIDGYQHLFKQLDALEQLPINANILNNEINQDGIYFPNTIILEPDFLFDVTAISECFGAYGNQQAGYLMRKFNKKSVSRPLIIGNISNYFLDQLIYQPNLIFKDVVKHIFKIDALGIALLSDQEVREMVVLLERHFNNIKKTITQLGKINISKDDCHIEPTFYAPKYGLQGRLDLFAFDGQTATIIELKSGSPFNPNSYGLSNNHYHQTLLYDLLIENTYGKEIKRNNFILYSKEATKQLRYAPAIKSEQREAIKERNKLLLHDLALKSSDNFIEYLRIYFKKEIKLIKGFLKKDINKFFEAFNQLNKTEIEYANRIFQFVQKEIRYSKLGNNNKNKGLASVWLEETDTKIENFNIINHLAVIADQSHEDDPIVVLQYSDDTATINNFRKGDIGLLYPLLEEESFTKNQVFKVTVTSLEQNQVTIRLRSRQEKENTFKAFDRWHIEHDHLDNTYTEMTRSLYEFAASQEKYRQLILGEQAPSIYEYHVHACSHHLTDEQQQIFSEIIQSKDYYLLWGPPGTGKTSIMLREIAHHYIYHEKDRILLLAYTNRAVDEICEALSSLDHPPEFIRVGSRYSTHEKFHKNLLDLQLAPLNSRKELRAKLSQTQVFVGTLSSVVGKVSLFDLIKFDVAIIDEASQILEPSLIGLLSRVQKFILIGDHLQLPAIVQQTREESEVHSEQLRNNEIKNFNTSLFERLYTHALKNNWEHAIGQLTFQGRMHEDIMAFVNDHFYDQRLKALPQIKRLTESSFFPKIEALPRLQYIESEVDVENESIKVNYSETEIVANYCKHLFDLFKKNDIKITPSSIGVITPYRAQIASIKRKLSEIDPTFIELVTVDTVERYQGGARDFIIMSCCMNYSFQLETLISLSESGIDRKLNVALSRAKEQFTLIGNRDILTKNEVYKNLIEISRLRDPNEFMSL